MNYLYHGSTVQDLKVLEPRKRFTPGEDFQDTVVYATHVPAYAAAHAFPWSSDEGFDIALEHQKVVLLVPNAHKERLNVPISLYKISTEHFIRTLDEETGLTWHAGVPISVLEEKTYSNVSQALQENDGEVRYI